PDLAALAASCHAHGERAETSEQLEAALGRALRAVEAGKVAVVDVAVDQS
ncbi:MAG: thiamine pyrophosphate-dependent enzyme, partial [Acidimicrobiales bacterium]